MFSREEATAPPLRCVCPANSVSASGARDGLPVRRCVARGESGAACVQEVELGAARKAFDLALPSLGPYSLSFSRSGRYMAFCGGRGHLALLDWSRMYPACEAQVHETVRDVCVLHNEQFFAAAQKKYVYIYDKRGIEVHCCKSHLEPRALDFLPHHFLMVSTGDTGARAALVL